MKNLSPIILFVYNRTEHTKKTVEALLKNNQANEYGLFIFSDGAKNQKDEQNVNSVRNYIKSIKGFKNVEIIFREKNLGLANSVISGVNDVFRNNESVIVIEDDILTSPDYLTFMNQALSFYQSDQKIFSISGYPYPISIPTSYKQDIFISYRASSWGWGTWKDRWEKADWDVTDFSNFISDYKAMKQFQKGGEDLTPMLKAQMKGKVDSWAVRWSYTHFKNNSYCLYPVVPLCKNIGTDRSGTHSSASNKYDVILLNSFKDFKLTENPELNDEIQKQIQKLFKISTVRKIINFLKHS